MDRSGQHRSNQHLGTGRIIRLEIEGMHVRSFLSFLPRSRCGRRRRTGARRRACLVVAVVQVEKILVTYRSATSRTDRFTNPFHTAPLRSLAWSSSTRIHSPDAIRRRAKIRCRSLGSAARQPRVILTGAFSTISNLTEPLGERLFQGRTEPNPRRLGPGMDLIVYEDRYRTQPASVPINIFNHLCSTKYQAIVYLQETGQKT